MSYRQVRFNSENVDARYVADFIKVGEFGCVQVRLEVAELRVTVEKAGRHEGGEDRVEFAAGQNIEQWPLARDGLDPPRPCVRAEPVHDRMRLGQTAGKPAHVLDAPPRQCEGGPRPGVAGILPTRDTDAPALEVLETGQRTRAGGDDAPVAEAAHEEIRHTEDPGVA